MSIKLIALDMDGTLLDNDHATVPPRNVAALRAASERGVKIAIASGRAWCLVEDVAREMGFVDYAVLANGAAIRDVRTGECLYREGMGEEQVRAIVRLLRARDIPFEVYQNGRSYMDGSCGVEKAKAAAVVSPAFAKVLFEHMTYTDDMERTLAGDMAEKFNVFHVEPEEREELLAAIAATGPVACASSTASNLEITSPKADKGAALAVLCGRLGITPEEVMAFGDAENDLGMLSWAGCSFAMANGSKGAKAAAKRITGPNHEAGGCFLYCGRRGPPCGCDWGPAGRGIQSIYGCATAADASPARRARRHRPHPGSSR